MRGLVPIMLVVFLVTHAGCGGSDAESTAASSPPSGDDTRYCGIVLKLDPVITKQSLSSYNPDTIEADLVRLNELITAGSRWLVANVQWNGNTTEIRKVEISVFKSRSSWQTVTVESAEAELDCTAEQLRTNAFYRLHSSLTLFSDAEGKKSLCTIPSGTEFARSTLGTAAFGMISFSEPPPGCETLERNRVYRMNNLGVPGYTLIRK